MKLLIIFINLVALHHHCSAVHLQMISAEGLEPFQTPDLSPFMKFGNKYYLFDFTKKVSWFEAADICRTYGAHLASIQSEEENEELTTYLEQIGQKIYMWIGANDLAKEGEFRWHITGLPLDFNQWNVNQPDNAFGNEQCTHMFYERNKFLWNDNNCGYNFSYICEAPTPKTVALTVW